MVNVKEAVERRIIELCNERNMAINGLANISGVSASTVYSMLNEKQAETAQLVGDLQKLTKQIRDLDLETTIKNLEDAANHAISVEKTFEPIAAPVVEVKEEEAVVNETTNLKDFQDVPEETPVLSKNEQILLLYKEGKDEVEIAKTLDCGLGEVRLVLGLYNNEA